MSGATATYTSTSSNPATSGAKAELCPPEEPRPAFMSLREDIAALVEKSIKEMENRDLDLRSRAKALTEKERKLQQREQLLADRERTLADKERALGEREKKVGRDEKRAEEERKRHDLVKAKVADLQQKTEANAKEFEKRLAQMQQSLSQAESERDSLREQEARGHPEGEGDEEVQVHEGRHEPENRYHAGAGFYPPNYGEADAAAEEERPPQPLYYAQPHSLPQPVPHLPYLPPQQFRGYKYPPPPGRPYAYPQPHPFFQVPRVYNHGMYPPHMGNGLPPPHLERTAPGEEEEGEAENHEWREQYPSGGGHAGEEADHSEHHQPPHVGYGQPPFWAEKR